MSDRSNDRRWLRRALQLAALGGRQVAPNPLVGAVLVKDGRKIGEGWHVRAGGPHAERQALASASENPSGSTLYVSLEPCHRHGRTPPCTDAILAAGVSRVVCAMPDPNPAEQGSSLRLLEQAGVEVDCGLLAEDARSLNEIYCCNQEKGRPWVLLKTASTLNGKIARADGHSRWISGEKSRRESHQMRAMVDGVAVGAITAELDRPALDLRLLRPTDAVLPRPIVFAGGSQQLPLPERWREREPMLVAAEDAALTVAEGWKVLRVDADENGRPHPAAALSALKEEGIMSLMVEGGGRLHASFLESGLWDRWELFLAPRLFPADGRSHWPLPGELAGLSIEAFSRRGEDLQISLVPAEPEK